MRRSPGIKAVVVLGAGVLLGILAFGGPPQPSFHIVIEGGRVLDGTGVPWYRADIGIQDDRIIAVGDLSDVGAERRIDAGGLYVAPGFIDNHSHAASGLASEELSSAHPLLAQGVTTVAVNPDGGGRVVDLARQRAKLLEHGLGVNVARYIGHGAVRQEVLGMANRAPTDEELDRMRELVREAMEEGGLGLASGLYYAPGSYAETGEVIELARVAGEHGGVYSSHIRDEADYNIGVVAAVEEVVTIAREGALPGIVTHIKVLGPRAWGLADTVIARIDEARGAGVEIWADQYPYAASGSGVTGALVPRWAQDGGHEELVRRIDRPGEGPRLREEMLENLVERRGGADRLQIRRFAPDPSIEGRFLSDLADERGLHPVDFAIELLREGGASFVSHVMREEDVEAFMRQSWTMIASDGGLVPFGEGVPHPRNYGTFSRVIHRYVQERGTLSLEEAVRKSSMLPAQALRLSDRGVIRPGAVADVIIFDLDQTKDRATYLEPHQLSDGMIYVIVNGILTVEGGRFTDAVPGRVIGPGTGGDR